MLIEIPFPSGTPVASGVACDAGHDKAIAQILSAAAQASSCPIALLYVEEDAHYRLVASVGHSGDDRFRLVRDPLARSADLAAQDDAGAPPWQLQLGGKPFDGRIAVAALSSVGGRQAVLVVARRGEGPPLSAAQGYVLDAHGAHLATLLDLAAERHSLASDQEARYRAQVERLRLLESVAVHARDSIVITEAEPLDRPGPRILYCNAAFTQTTGYTEAEVLGQTPRILQGPKTSPEARARLREALANWQPIEIEMVNYRKDGSEFDVELSIVPVADERGWFTHWVSVQRDITERKAAEELATRVRLAEVKNEVLATEIQERKKIEAQLLYTAFHDDLTGLRNRAFFMDRLSAAIAAGGPSRPAVVFLDLDRFKVVNDSLGHASGDALLREIALRLKHCTRPQDTLARIGGDEFALLIEDGDDLATAIGIAERILEAMKAPVRLVGQDVYPSCSVGVVQGAEEHRSPEDLIRDADVAMYHVKRSGRGDFAVFSEPMRGAAMAALSLEADLRLALERQEFLLEYQPIIRPETGQVAGFEALLRWEHPQRGRVAPIDFVGAAEEIGLIRQIDRWALREACRQLAGWRALAADQDLYVSVNASAVEFLDPRFADDVTDALGEFGLPPRCLEIEITEGLFLSPTPGVSGALERLRSLGVRIALDDFGTGFSSLSYLNRYPVDTIKIDRCFIGGMCGDRRTLAIVELIVKLGSALDVTIVAEGVEDAAQAKLLSDMGCARVQGYFFSRPLDPDAAAELLTRRHALSANRKSWRTREDSNLWPLPSEGSALSS